MLRPGLRLMKSLMWPLLLMVLVTVLIYTQNYFTPGYSRWLMSNPLRCPNCTTTTYKPCDIQEIFMDYDDDNCKCDKQKDKTKPVRVYNILRSTLTLRKAVTSQTTSNNTVTSVKEKSAGGPTWDALYSPEQVRRREHAYNACLREGEHPDVVGDLVGFVRHGRASGSVTSYCGKPEAKYVAKDGSEAGVMFNEMTSYCWVPKIACSFWLSVFRVLCNDTEGIKYKSPFMMSRAVIHYYKFEKIEFYNRTHLTNAADDFRFMFVREPYSRLWSAYIDKLFLPDFWFATGTIISGQRKKGEKTTKSTCGSDVQFSEFLDYLVAYDPQVHNNHWKPIHHQCSPCLYRPHFIGKLETFANDAKIVLKHLNASYMLDTYDQSKRVHVEVKQLIDYNYDIIKRAEHINCTNGSDLAQRLWAAFQYNGYISTDAKYPFAPEVDVVKGKLQEAAYAAVDAGKSKSKVDWRKQRETAMLNAYKSVSTQTMQKIRDLYWLDFVMYDYDPEPSKLWKGREYDERTFRGEK